MTKTEQLKPCPFCGESARIASGRLEFWAYCPHCGISTGYCRTPQEVAEVWNTRQAEDVAEFVDGDMTEEDRIKIEESLNKIADENELPDFSGKLESEIERLKTENTGLRNYLRTARFYLSKVDSYISPIADEAHYFWDIQLEKALKDGAAGYYSF